MPQPITPEPQSLNLQTTSRLFRAPIEIRRAIYVHLISTAGVHIVRTEQGKIRLSPCVEPDLDAGHTGFERHTTGDWSTDAVWGRRLVSSWGPHWKCEEIALKRERERDEECEVAWRNNGALLRVCRRMHFEVGELMKRLVCFNVTDLNTLDALLEISGASPSGPFPSTPFGFKESLLPHITKLDITLRLPLSIFQALDGPHATKDGSFTSVFKDDIKIWSGIFPRITQLKELRSLRIWLDHSNKAYWSVVNERAILSQLEPLASIPHLDLSFDLPKLHPQLEDSERHFVGEDNTTNSSFALLSPFKICRRLRQRYHGEENRIGNYRVIYASDFPLCYGHPSYEHMSLADMEKWERGMWQAGVNVKHILSLPGIE